MEQEAPLVAAEVEASKQGSQVAEDEELREAEVLLLAVEGVQEEGVMASEEVGEAVEDTSACALFGVGAQASLCTNTTTTRPKTGYSKTQCIQFARNQCESHSLSHSAGHGISFP